jgi:transposase
METPHLAGFKKKAAAERRTIVFIDESGLSERPTVVRTWAPRGQTPQLEFSFRWNHVSVIAGVTWWNFYFRLHPGAIRGPQAAEFLGQLRRQIHRPLLIIWDGLAVHRSRKVKAFLARHPGEVHLAQLPGYAPELNPVEYLWGHLKQHGLANFCPRDLSGLGAEARRKLRRMRARPTLVRAFWKQADLSL